MTHHKCLPLDSPELILMFYLGLHLLPEQFILLQLCIQNFVCSFLSSFVSCPPVHAVCLACVLLDLNTSVFKTKNCAAVCYVTLYNVQSQWSSLTTSVFFIPPVFNLLLYKGNCKWDFCSSFQQTCHVDFNTCT